ncbi:histone-like nucleoid-structuring protein, MvaT/MvaU family [Pseudomonas alliivorans]|uniref:histone-like nucleoid-structuring protein, MvaT/MvaU family n=1 Tax=Pseudomonas koreensis TaxID=198620 RepID=UPI00266C23E5|nr:histone-like nucleoid-structuring protein, MvaT/MvaU family [Pseudomonas koreensis]MEE4914987.1 histone-like nucleoid-structuring protein, MvaT/MvaU family [Pseudomonas alliivorans]
MTSLNEYLSLKDKLTQLEEKPGLAKDLAFTEEFIRLKDRYNFTASDVLRLIKPGLAFTEISSIEHIHEALQSIAKDAPATKSTAKSMRRYRNPHTGEVVETRGSNHNRLKAWKEQFGSDAVTSWRVI